VTSPLPGALRFLVGIGAGGATLLSGCTEKLDIPGMLLFWAFEIVALLLGGTPLGVAVDERRVFPADALSLSPDCRLLGMVALKAP